MYVGHSKRVTLGLINTTGLRNFVPPSKKNTKFKKVRPIFKKPVGVKRDAKFAMWPDSFQYYQRLLNTKIAVESQSCGVTNTAIIGSEILLAQSTSSPGSVLMATSSFTFTAGF